MQTEVQAPALTNHESLKKALGYRYRVAYKKHFLTGAIMKGLTITAVTHCVSSAAAISEAAECDGKTVLTDLTGNQYVRHSPTIQPM
jgi:hypothetical protein